MNPILCERMLAKFAVRALYFEVKAYPKPGLVSFIDAGAHQDMDGGSFYRSLFTLRHYFYQIAKKGLVEESFDPLKHLAIEAEQRMLVQTQGVNTHRGAIFALGLFCVSVMRLAQQKNYFTPDEVQQQILSDWPKHLMSHQGNLQSHGALVGNKYRIVGAKQMAIQGYEVVFQLLPAIIALFIETDSIDCVCLYAYLELLVQMNDTNILYRKGQMGLDYAQGRAAELLNIPCLQTRKQKAMKLHHIFSDMNISPGGVADLISVLLFLGQLFCQPLREYSQKTLKIQAIL